MSPHDDRLPCGAELEALVAQATEGTPAADPRHQERCPYCQTALRGLGTAWEDVRALARVPVPVPHGLTVRVMRRVRNLAGRAARNLILAVPRGRTQISHDVIARVAGHTALAVPDVHFASARPAPGRPGEPDRLDLSVRLVAAYGPALHAVAAAVRAVLRRRLRTLTGADVGQIDITFSDLDHRA